ncbi:MAG: hypothetical protein ACTS45_01750 [Candidatus Hodgkinia cicadicola]
MCSNSFPADEMDWSNSIGGDFWQTLNRLFESYNEAVKTVISEKVTFGTVEDFEAAEKSQPSFSDNLITLQPDVWASIMTLMMMMKRSIKLQVLSFQTKLLRMWYYLKLKWNY